MVNKKHQMPESGILRGAGPLALYLWGDEKKARAIYGMSDEEKRKLGLFNQGKHICGLKTVIDQRIREQAEGGAS
jgi:hypothetical protein